MALPALNAVDIERYIVHFSGSQYKEWLQSNWIIPFSATATYFVFVFGGQAIMSKLSAFELTFFTRLWNFLIATYSIIGATFVIPHLVESIQTKGVRYTVCTPAEIFYYNGPVGFFAFSFMWSKFFEFIDTVFLVLRKREVIFLHWYHHITVLLFCWHCFSQGVSFAFWFCVMNYTVHAIMYSYYFFMGFGLTRRLVRPIAPLITGLQIAQMIGGLAVLVVAHLERTASPVGCVLNEDNWRYGSVMYASYLVLFLHFFYRTYIAKDRKRDTPSPKPVSSKKNQ